MTPEAQRIAIAEACGLEIPHWAKEQNLMSWWNGPGYSDPREMPDYLNDLNAMHEAEKTLLRYEENSRDFGDNGFWGRYCDSLGKIGVGGLARSIHATAAQRAEAFLRTIGKWEDDK